MTKDKQETRDTKDSLRTYNTKSKRILRWVVIFGTVAIFAAIVAVALFSTCGMPSPPPLPDPIEPPARTAVQDQAVRRLLSNVGQNRLCEQLQGRMMALPGSDAPTGRQGGQAPAKGRLWVERCQAEERAGMLALHLEGRGWTWANETRAGPLNSRFTVRGYLRFLLSVDLQGELDLGYSESTQVASVWFTPRVAPVARLNLQGPVPVQAQTGLGGVLGIFGSVFGSPVESRARPVVERFGANEIARRLTPGLTTTGELCTGQLDVYMGVLGDGETPLRPFPADGTIWLENGRTQINSGGIDVAGPWDSGGEALRLDIEVEEGGPAVARVLCQAQAHQVVEAFLARTPAPPVADLRSSTIGAGQLVTLRTDPTTCPVMLVMTPTPAASSGTRYRYRAIAGEGSPEPLMTCGN